MGDNFKIFYFPLSFYHSQNIQVDHKQFVYNIYLKIRDIIYISKFMGLSFFD